MSVSSSSDSDGVPPVSPRQRTVDTHHGVGLSNPQLSQGRRGMLDLVNRLHSTGVQVDIDLPQIAVIGSQSAGKSSLIESISGITLPRAAGTCTRCPTECRLSRSTGPWKCVVALRFITDARGQTLGQVRNETFGPTIFKKSEVEERIRRAQRAILNPSSESQQYLRGEDEDGGEAELSFSTNCVSLQISGPDVADLSFCDLPGLIASVGRGGNLNDINLVQSLVTSYIKKTSCVILLTVACETDFENQGAHRLAKDHDPEGKRTIGVLTKPDRIPQGEENNWLSFIKNEKEALENNWYCVKQPNSNDLKQGMTWTQARTREDEFFSMTAPWSELEPLYQRYLRTSNLVDRLSSILSDLISKRLPQIQDELEKAIVKTQEALIRLPKEPSKDPHNEIANLIHVFTADLSKHIQGIPDDDGLIQTIRPAQARFRRVIQLTAPQFRPYERQHRGLKTLPPPTFLYNEEGRSVSFSDDGERTDTDEPPHVLDDAPAPKGKEKLGGKIFYIDEVFRIALRARTRELPGNYPFVVQKTFIDSAIQQWRAPAQHLCKTTHAILVDHIRSLIVKHFGSFGQGGLEQRVKILLQDQMKRCAERAEERVEWLLSLEDQPFSLNTHYLASYKSKFLSYYKGARQKGESAMVMKTIQDYVPGSTTTSRNSNSQAPTGVAKILVGLAEIGMSGVNPEDLAKLLPPDQMEPALVIMADVRAYFQVAYKRFADNVPLAIDRELVRGMERNVLSILNTGLGINGPDGRRICKELALENPHIAARREELSKKLERLDVASQELLRISF